MAHRHRHNNYGYGIVTNIDVEQIEFSLQMMYGLFNNKCHINLLEIGFRDGSTSRAINKKLQEMEVKDYDYWAIDNNRDNKTVKPFDTCKVIMGNSEEVFYQVPDNLHWVFIDACHCCNHVMLDFLNYGEKVVNGGFLLFHDTNPDIQNKINGYQHHGPKIGEFCTAVEMALKKVDIFNNSSWKFISNKYDKSKNFGGVAIFQKIK